MLVIFPLALAKTSLEGAKHFSMQYVGHMSGYKIEEIFQEVAPDEVIFT